MSSYLRMAHNMVRASLEHTTITPLNALVLLHQLKEQSDDHRTILSMAREYNIKPSDLTGAYRICKDNGFCESVDNRKSKVSYNITSEGEQFLIDFIIFNHTWL